jgi:pimeloyl-ACP methyl ester carboxylesterase
MLSWEDAIGPLAQAHLVLAPDLPGYGRSDRPQAAYSTDYYVRFVADFLEVVGVGPCHLVGLSLGGAIALGFTLAAPEQVRRLVLVDSYGLQTHVPQHRLSYMAVNLPLLTELTYWWVGRSEAAARATLQSVVHDPRRLSPALVHEVMREARRPGVGRAFQVYQRREMRWDGLRTCFIPRLAEVRAPTLFIHGAQDRLVPLACARTGQARLPGSQLHIMPGCGHWTQREQPAEFNQIVADFLRE